MKWYVPVVAAVVLVVVLAAVGLSSCGRGAPPTPDAGATREAMFLEFSATMTAEAPVETATPTLAPTDPPAPTAAVPPTNTPAPIRTATATAVVTATPAPGGLGVGVTAEVSGTEGRGLRLRLEPSTDQAVIKVVPDGTRLQILAGPTTAGGYTWYRVRDAAGAEGWVADEWLVVPQ